MMEYGRLTGLKPEEFQHPGEVYYMKALKSIPLLDKIISEVMQAGSEWQDKSDTTGNNCRITDRTNPRVYRLYQKALERLDMPKEYPLYSKLEYEYNAMTVGTKNPFIFIHTSCLDDYTDGEILRTLGHELGHIKCQHVLYHSVASSLNAIAASLGIIGTGVMQTIGLALANWTRCSEFTADRAGLIACGEVDSCQICFRRAMGGSTDIKGMNYSMDKVLAQADDFDMETADIIGKLLYAGYTMSARHPWTVQRLRQINDWYQSGEYEEIVRRHVG
ncbi:MAG: M48 family metallopeptidase [Lachnospiraceae bacterium]|nr:M48 family metallopeptidase [Lachnospiraceae bacterium]